MSATAPPMQAIHRVLVAAAAGVVVAAVIAWLLPWQLTALVAYDVAALVHLALIWGSIVRRWHVPTEELATREDDSRAASSATVLIASVVSIVGVLLGVIKANDEHGARELVLTLVALVTVIISWLTVHTLFTLRYAHLYYRDEPGGVDFNEPTPPDYADFAYLAFTVGMTYQVSDTGISDRGIRRSILRHALLSFLFGTVIIALTINALAGLIG